MTQHSTPSQDDKATKKRKRKKISERYLKNAGLAYLQRFPASTNHFRTVMCRKIDKSCKDHPDQNRHECIELLDQTIIPYFQNAGYLNDSLFAKGLADSLKRRGLPLRMIAMKMRVKGITDTDIQNALASDECTDEQDWQALIIFARRKRCGLFRPDYSTELRDKDMGKLARAGFSYQLIDRFLSMEPDEFRDIVV